MMERGSKTEPSFHAGTRQSAGGHEELGSISAGLLLQLEQNRLAEREGLERLLRLHLEEQRRARRWRGAFRFFIAAYLVALLWLGGQHADSLDVEALSGSQKHTAVVRIGGAIFPGGDFAADKVIQSLGNAFKDRNTAGVVIQINSPGGSAVQAGMIHDEIQRLRTKYPEIPVYAALEDLCASGGYYVAAAAQEIYADKATLVGSIGVILQGFGMQEAMNKLGLESRTITSGADKNLLDPFKPVDEKQKAHMQSVLNTVHDQFVQAVKRGRGDRLREQHNRLFTGLVWTGEEAVRLGLVDALGSTAALARDHIKAEKQVDFTVPKSDWRTDWLHKLSIGLDALGSLGGGGVAGRGWGLPWL
jgi:protease-4